MNIKKTDFYGVILAAGRGNRIKPLSFEIPKPLLPVCNKPIIQYQMEAMIELGIKDFIIVVGHLKEKIENYFGNGSSMGVKIKYIEQKESLGIAHAVGQLENHINKPFLLFLGDIFIVPKNFREIVNVFYKDKADAVLAVKKELDLKSIQNNFTVILGDDSKKVKRVIEKPRYLTTNMKGCGIYLFNLSIFDAIRNTPRTAMRDEYEITTSIQILIDDNCSVYTADVVEWDMNVTTPHDLLKCNQKWMKHIGKDKFIHPEAEIHEKTRISNSVIGKNVTVVHPVTIENSVVLEGVTLRTKKNIFDSLVSPNNIVVCNREKKEL